MVTYLVLKSGGTQFLIQAPTINCRQTCCIILPKNAMLPLFSFTFFFSFFWYGQIFLRYNCVLLWVRGNIQLLSKPLWDQGECIEQSPPSSDQIQGGKTLWHRCNSLQWLGNWLYQYLFKNVLTTGCIRVGRLRMRAEKCQPSGYYLLFFKKHKLIHCILKGPLAQFQVNG